METQETIKEKVTRMIELRKGGTANRIIAQEIGWPKGRIVALLLLLRKKGIVPSGNSSSENRMIKQHIDSLPSGDIS